MCNGVTHVIIHGQQGRDVCNALHTDVCNALHTHVCNENALHTCVMRITQCVTHCVINYMYMEPLIESDN